MTREGDEAPDFCLPDKDGKEICLEDFKNNWIVLYFYPRDNTTGCTREAVDFSSHLEEFEKMNAVVIGISPDSSQSHVKFADKYDLRHMLLSDEKHEVSKKYGVWQRKKMYGREYYGVVRSTFVINPEGKVAHVWRNVKVEGHVEEVKNALKKL